MIHLSKKALLSLIVQLCSDDILDSLYSFPTFLTLQCVHPYMQLI